MQRPTGGSFDATNAAGGVFFATKGPPPQLRHSASFGGVLPGGGVTMSAPQSPMNARAHGEYCLPPFVDVWCLAIYMIGEVLSRVRFNERSRPELSAARTGSG